MMAGRRSRILRFAVIALQCNSSFPLQSLRCRRLFSLETVLLRSSSTPQRILLQVRFFVPFAGSTAHEGRFFATSNSTDGNNSADSIESIQNRTLQWLKRVVIGLNLCPFAELPYRQKQIRIHVVPGNDTTLVLEQLLEELLYRQRDAPGTTLVVCPDLFPNDFDEFWSVASFVDNTLIPEYGLSGEIQVAPFHPLFVFDGSNDDTSNNNSSRSSGSDNYTNRAPFPIFHILREDEVSRAVDQLPDGNAATVWRRNVDLLELLQNELTRDEFETVMSGSTSLDQNSDTKLHHRVQQILRQFRVQLASLRPSAKTRDTNPKEDENFDENSNCS